MRQSGAVAWVFRPTGSETVKKCAASTFLVAFFFLGCKSESQNVPLENRPITVPAPPAAEVPSPTTVAGEPAPKIVVPRKKVSTADIASRPVPDAEYAPFNTGAALAVHTAAKPLATLTLEEIPPEPPRPRAVLAAQVVTRRLPQISPKVWYGVATVCGAMFSYILAPLLVELLKDCMPRRRHHQPATVAWTPLPRFPHWRPWPRRG